MGRAYPFAVPIGRGHCEGEAFGFLNAAAVQCLVDDLIVMPFDDAIQRPTCSPQDHLPRQHRTDSAVGPEKNDVGPQVRREQSQTVRKRIADAARNEDRLSAPRVLPHQGADPLRIVAKKGGDDVDILLSVGSGKGTARMWTCDLSYDYVRINAEYTT